MALYSIFYGVVADARRPSSPFTLYCNTSGAWFAAVAACVVALGGGIVETPAALTLLAGHPRVLGLRIRPETELARRGGADERPALTDRQLAEEIRELHERRFPLYEKACSGRWIDVEGMKADSFHRLLQRLKLLL